MVFRLGAVHVDSTICQIDVSPLQAECLRRAPQAAVAAKCEDESPFSIRTGLKDPFRLATADKVEAIAYSCKMMGQTRRETITTDSLLIHFGVIPRINLTKAAGCEHIWDDGQQCWRPDDQLPGARGGRQPGVRALPLLLERHGDDSRRWVHLRSG